MLKNIKYYSISYNTSKEKMWVTDAVLIYFSPSLKDIGKEN